jgi:hypothetical protein
MGTPSPGWDSLVRESAASARYRRRRRRRIVQRVMLSLLAVVTTGALAVIVMFVKDISKVPTVAAPAALSSSARTVTGASAAAHRVTPQSGTSPVSGPRVTDAASGLSYRLLASPWHAGCPAVLNTPMFRWNAGENAVAGQVTINGSAFGWHGNACSGQLQQQFQYSGPADLEPTAMSLVGAVDPAYYDPLVHSRTVEDSAATQVSGHQAWLVKFLISYPDAAAEGLNWTSELGAVVVVDRGAGLAPAIFYVSVPANLGTGNVSVLIASLRFS